MRIVTVLLIVTFKLNLAETPAYRNLWVVWNIGQGQWVTHVTSDTCVHFDMGGEFGSFKTVKSRFLQLCGRKPNRLHLSHWDYDHYLNITAVAKAVPRLCWDTLPEYGHFKPTAKKILDLEIPTCTSAGENLTVWLPTSARNTNEASAVFLVENKVLLPGDSPIAQEKIWQQKLDVARAQILILGHHGSRTSTGLDLLARLTQVKLAISSARFAKYRHPHIETLNRMSKFKIPVLRTEDWGNIWFY